MNRIEEIKELYYSIEENFESPEDRNIFCKHIAEKLGSTFSTVKINWFYKFEITKRHGFHDLLIKHMKDYKKK